jgi:hypothetical protein
MWVVPEREWLGTTLNIGRKFESRSDFEKALGQSYSKTLRWQLLE